MTLSRSFLLIGLLSSISASKAQYPDKGRDSVLLSRSVEQVYERAYYVPVLRGDAVISVTSKDSVEPFDSLIHEERSVLMVQGKVKSYFPVYTRNYKVELFREPIYSGDTLFLLKRFSQGSMDYEEYNLAPKNQNTNQVLAFQPNYFTLEPQVTKRNEKGLIIEAVSSMGGTIYSGGSIYQQSTLYTYLYNEMNELIEKKSFDTFRVPEATWVYTYYDNGLIHTIQYTDEKGNRSHQAFEYVYNNNL